MRITPGLMAARLALGRSQEMLAATDAGALRWTVAVYTSFAIFHKRQ
jgi:hypothetical protein